MPSSLLNPSGSHTKTRGRFGRRLNLAIILVCVVAIAAIWVGTLHRIANEREQAQAAAMKSNSNLAVAFEQQVFRTIKAAEQVAVFVRDQYLLRGSAVNLRRWVEQQLIREELFTIVNVLDEAGSILISSSEAAESVNYADRAFFQALRKSTEDTLYVSAPVLGRISGQWQIPMALRIAKADGSFGGLVVMSVSPQHFSRFYGQSDLGAQGLLELSGTDGVVRSLTLGGKNSFGGDARQNAWFQRHKTATEGAFIDNGDTLDQVARTISYRSVGGYPLIVSVGTALADDMAQVEQRRTGYLWMAAATTAIFLVMSGLLMLMLARQRAANNAMYASESLFRATFSQAAMGITHISPEGRILGANQKFCQMLGYAQDELRSLTLFELSQGEYQEKAQQFFTSRLQNPASSLSPEIEKIYQRKDGSPLWVCEALSVVVDTQGVPQYLVAVTQDITVRKSLEDRLSFAAMHDGLTGLPNRAMFIEQLSEALQLARQQHKLVAVLFIDLDGFKAVNDNQGHAVGDALLCQTARRLEGCTRQGDTVARLGGDEFSIALTSLAHISECEAIANRVIEALALPFEINGAQAQVSASVGVAVFPDHGQESSILLAQADKAMYTAKNGGKNRFHWAHPSPNQ